jgi:hypothetical protein
LGRRHKPSHWPVNWAVVGIAAVLTLAIGVTIVMLTSGGDRRGGIVVPTPATSQQQPDLIGSAQNNGPEPVIGGGTLPSTPGRPATPTGTPGR